MKGDRGKRGSREFAGPPGYEGSVGLLGFKVHKAMKVSEEQMAVTVYLEKWERKVKKVK